MKQEEIERMTDDILIWEFEKILRLNTPEKHRVGFYELIKRFRRLKLASLPSVQVDLREVENLIDAYCRTRLLPNKTDADLFRKHWQPLPAPPTDLPTQKQNDKPLRERIIDIFDSTNNLPFDERVDKIMAEIEKEKKQNVEG